jgi:hypothetical protein
MRIFKRLTVILIFFCRTNSRYTNITVVANCKFVLTGTLILLVLIEPLFTGEKD